MTAAEQPSKEAAQWLWDNLPLRDPCTKSEWLKTAEDFLDRFREAGVREERERIAGHIDCGERCRYASAGICRRTDELCHHHVAKIIRAGEIP